MSKKGLKRLFLRCGFLKSSPNSSVLFFFPQLELGRKIAKTSKSAMIHLNLAFAVWLTLKVTVNDSASLNRNSLTLNICVGKALALQRYIFCKEASGYFTAGCKVFGSDLTGNLSVCTDEERIRADISCYAASEIKYACRAKVTCDDQI